MFSNVHTTSAMLWYLIPCLVGVAFPPASYAYSPELPTEALAIRENAERLRTGEYRATGTFTTGKTKLPERPTRNQTGDRRFKFDRSEFEEARRRQERKPDKGQNDPLVRSPNVKDSPNENPLEEYAEEIESVFDYDTQRLAFRRTRRLTSETETPPYSIMRRAWFVGTPDRTLLVRGHDGPALEVTIQGSISSPSEVSLFFQPVFDARSMGWGGLDQLGIHYGSGFLANGEEDDIRVSEDEGNGIRRLETIRAVDKNPDLPGVASIWWFDERQGFQPVRFLRKGQYLHPSTPVQEAYNHGSKASEESELSWIKIGELWVLKSLDMRGEVPGRIEHLQLAFDWKSVNGEIGPEHFDWRSWSLPQGSRVVDMRMGDDKPILVEWVGTPTEVELPPPLKPATSNHHLLVLFNVIVVGLLAGWFLKRFLRNRHASRVV